MRRESAAVGGGGRLALAWLSLALAMGGSATAALRYEALAISAPKVLALAPDPRFDPSDRGTVEFWLAIAPLQPDTPADAAGNRSLCIAEHGSGEALDWRISLVTSGDSDTLRFGRPADGAHVDVPMKLRGTEYHHFAFVTAGGRTQAIVDGKRSNGIGDDRTPTPEPRSAIGPPFPTACR